MYHLVPERFTCITTTIGVTAPTNIDALVVYYNNAHIYTNVYIYLEWISCIICVCVIQPPSRHFAAIESLQARCCHSRLLPHLITLPHQSNHLHCSLHELCLTND
jgi:hypothetical protein